MDQGQTVYKGHAFISTAGEPLHYMQQGTITGIEAHGAVLVRIARAPDYGGDQYVPVDGWRADAREALADANTQLDAIEQIFAGRMEAARAEIQKRFDELDKVAEVHG